MFALPGPHQQKLLNPQYNMKYNSPKCGSHCSPLAFGDLALLLSLILSLKRPGQGELREPIR